MSAEVGSRAVRDQALHCIRMTVLTGRESSAKTKSDGRVCVVSKCGGTNSSSAAARLHLFLFCRLVGTASGDVFPEQGLTGSGSWTADVVDSTDADETSSTVGKEGFISALSALFLLCTPSLLADTGRFECEAELRKVKGSSQLLGQCLCSNAVHARPAYPLS